MKIYTISGLGADQRVFQKLDIGHELIHLSWIQPHANEALASYARRLSQSIDPNEDFVLIGVSFGGIIAVEIEKILDPQKVILLSSAQVKQDLNPVFRLLGKTRILQLLPTSAFRPKPKYVGKLFGTAPEDQPLLEAILEDSDSRFAKWAMDQIARWHNTQRSDSVVMIHGTKDKVMRCPSRKEVIKIKEAGHFMVLDRADEINHLIRTIISA